MEMLAWTWVDIAQMVLAVALGFIVGFQRELEHKPAGVTTITIVTLASTLIMQLSYKLPGIGMDGPADPARLAAAVITGIGFLGAGVILRTGVHIQGITTAATIWLMAGVGLAVGASYYVPALTVVVLVWLGFAVDPYIERLVEKRRLARKRRATSSPPVDE